MRTITLLPILNNQWEYELWDIDLVKGGRRYVGSNGFAYAAAELALTAAKEHIEELKNLDKQ